MSFIGATGLDEVQEQFDILKDNIDANASFINTLVGLPDPTHTPIFGINILNPGLFGLVERAEVNIKALQLGEEGIGTNISGIETEISGIQTEITGIQGEITAVEGSISTIQFVEIPALGVAIGLADGIAVDALSKANKSLGIWDESGNNVYHKKSGNVGIGTTFGSVLNNKLEVNGNINIPTGSTFRINNEPFNYTHLAGTQPVSSKWTNATDTATNIYYNTGNVGIGTISGITNKLEVGGNLNISTGSKYKINNVNLAFSDLGGTLSYNSLTDKLTQGTNISIVGNVINNTYSLPTASTSVLGGVRVDGSSITINNGVITGANTYTLPIATTSVIGGVRPDGNTITINSTTGVITATAGASYTLPIATTAVIGGVRPDANTIVINGSTGVISSVQTQADWNNTDSSSRAFIQNKPTIINSKWGNTGADIYYNSGNVGIGTAQPNSGVDILKTTASGVSVDMLNMRYDSNWGLKVQQSYTGTGNIQYNLIHRYNAVDYNALTFKAGNVGIGTTNPQHILHLHKNALSQDVRIIITDNSCINRGFHLVKLTNNYTYVWNMENTPMIFGTNETERMRIEAGGNITIDRLLQIGGINNYNGGNTMKLQVYASDTNGNIAIFKHPNDSQGIGIRYDGIFQTNANAPLVLTTSGTGEIRFNTNGTERFKITNDCVKFQKDAWHSDLDNVARFYFATNSTTYINGNGTGDLCEFRNNTHTMRARIAANGQFGCHFQTISPTNTDHLGTIGDTGSGAFGFYYIHILYNTFTGFHRCYYEDDEVFNNDMSKEDIDIFKNNYKGRIVISTGKIKTDLSRTIPKEEPIEEVVEDITDEGIEEQPIEEPIKKMDRPINYEETKNENPNVEWYSVIDKDGITIEDAIPIVQLCKVRKDKRVYGVLGSPDRSTNNKGRLIVNSVGEGAICVCNTNGNIENGDYIQSSDILGYGEKQDDDLLHNYSVAKAVMDCNFELDSPYYQCYELASGIRVALIACTYHCG